MTNLHHIPSSCRHYIAISESSCEYPHISLLHRIVSPPSIKRMNPTQYVLIIVATTSKICSENPSMQNHPCTSQQSSCQSTNMQVSHYTSPPSILVYPKFDRYVITRFLADTNFHGHRPTVSTELSNLFYFHLDCLFQHQVHPLSHIMLTTICPLTIKIYHSFKV